MACIKLDAESFGKILYVSGLGAALIGGFNASLLLRGTRIPEEVAIAELGANDGTNNVHLTITDFQFGDGIVIETDEGNGKWKRVWIPILTQEGQWTARPVVFHSNSIKNEAKLQEILELKSATGIVSNFMQGLGSNQQAEFAKIYPNVNLDGAIAFTPDRRFPSPYFAYTLAIGGTIAFFLGIAIAFGWLESQPETEIISPTIVRD